jgi:hypothetical protein
MHWIDPTSLPETQGTVTQFLLNPHGDPDGFLLDGNRQVHVPPHLGRQIAQHIAIGDAVSVRGVKPRAADILAAVSVASATGVVFVDEGPCHDDHEQQTHDAAPRAIDVTGTVVCSLYGPKGELRGGVLDDGTSLRVPPHAAGELQAWLTPGARVQAWGDMVENRWGRTLAVSEMAEQVDAGTEA